MDDDDQIADDLEGKDITACKEDIEQLRAEKERRIEYTERLQEKLKALNNELAARNEEFDRRNKELQEEQRRNKRKADQNRELSEGNQAGAIVQLEDAEHMKVQREQVRSIMENQLQTLLQEKASSVALGMPLVEKPPDVVRKEAMRIDTVLITYLRANTDEKYFLSYRVGERVTAAVLRKDACFYWGLSEVEYILWTHTEGSKIHDELLIQNCFKPNEEARLVLRRKTPQEVRVMERERDAIRPLIGRNRKARGAKKGAAGAGADAGAQQVGASDQPEGILEQMAAVPGLREFMTRRDEWVVEHLDRIKLRNILLYGLLIVTSLLSLWTLMPPDVEYACRSGVYTAMTAQTQNAVAFKDIRSEQEAWGWLMNTVPDQLMSPASTLRETNYLPGWLHIRIQRVKAASRDQCTQKGFPAGVTCLAEKYDAATAGTEVLTNVRAAWQLRDERALNATLEATLSWEQQRSETIAAMTLSVNHSNYSNETTTTPYATTTSPAQPQDVRGSAQPWAFVSASEGSNPVVPEGGLYQSYDGSGYEIDYNLQTKDIADLSKYYRQDMQILKDEGWIDARTRAVHVSFTSYNGNYDLWVSSYFLIEIPGSGIMETSEDVQVYKPVLNDYGLGHQQFITDTIRLCVVLYILFVQIYKEWLYEKRVKDSYWTYLLGAQGLADLGLVACFLAAYGIRFLKFGILAVDTATYRAGLSDAAASLADGAGSVYRPVLSTQDAQIYRQHVTLEGFILCLAVFRFVSFMRINRQVFIIWKTIKESLSASRHLLLCALPAVPGFVVLAHVLWRPLLPTYRTFWSSLASIMMIMLGQRDMIQATSDLSRPWTAVFSMLFYATVVLVLVNSIIATLVNVYQRVRITSGYVARLYDWEEYQYVQWSIWKPVATVYAWLRGSRMRIPFREEDDD